jgi:hypothetical protein
MLDNPIHEYHQREWFNQGFLPLTCISLTQERTNSLGEAFEQAMQIEAMAGYPRGSRVMIPPEDANILQLHG